MTTIAAAMKGNVNGSGTTGRKIIAILWYAVMCITRSAIGSMDTFPKAHRTIVQKRSTRKNLWLPSCTQMPEIAGVTCAKFDGYLEWGNGGPSSGGTGHSDCSDDSEAASPRDTSCT